MFQFSELKIPVVQAPMAGGPNTPALASAVSNSGGVGSFGFAYSTPKKIKADMTATRALTMGPINANFFVFKPETLPGNEIQSAALEALKNLPIEGEYTLTIPSAPFFPNVEMQLETIWEFPPDILTFHFGIPAETIIEKAQSLGISVGVTATDPKEALAVEESGANFIVAQGIEAGGHRGTFNPEDEDEDLYLDDLIKKLVKLTHLPIVAAGAIMGGGDIARVLKLGATAVQMGTAFLCCAETVISDAHREFLINGHDRKTSFTKAFSGRRAQGINNEFIRRMRGQTILPFPLQNSLTGPIRQLALKNNDGEYQSLWAGTGYHKIQAMPAGQFMAQLTKELQFSKL